MNHKTIWNEEQNKPTLVVRDLSSFVSPDIVYESLLRRGVFKWLSVRRDLIKIKNVWKSRVTESIKVQKSCTNHKAEYWRGYRKAVEECRAEVRQMCHSDRWRAPDFDREANNWLNKYHVS